jgi:hypothetical protein
MDQDANRSEDAVVVMEMVVRRRFFPKIYEWARKDHDALVSALMAMMRRERMEEPASAILTLECSLA